MNYSKILILILLVSISLEAAYTRSIRVSTLYTDSASKKEIKKLNRFIKSHKNLVQLQEKWGFEVLSQKSGKYWLNVIEPIDDKQVLKEVIKTIRTRYPDSYAKKIKKNIVIKEVSKPKVIPEIKTPTKIEIAPKVEVTPIVKALPIVDTPIVEATVQIEEAIVVEEVIEEKLTVKEEVKQVEKVKQEEKVIPEVIYVQEKQNEEVVTEEPKKIVLANNTETDIWKISFFAMLFLFLLAIILLLLSKKKNRKIRKKERNIKMEKEEKDIQYSSQIKNNENFLSEAQTSMSSVIQYSNLLLEFDLSVIQKDYVQRIKSASASLLNVVNNTSDISKIQVGELEIHAIDFNLRNMIAEVSNIISLEAKQNHVHLTIDVHEDIPDNVIGDSIHLKQVLVSLLTNSVKYTREGEVTLTLKKVYSYSHAITLSFIVSDTGIGMSPEQIDSIIYATRNNTSTNLSVSKQLIQRMNGDMKIYSTLGVGSTFTFNIKFDLQQ